MRLPRLHASCKRAAASAPLILLACSGGLAPERTVNQPAEPPTGPDWIWQLPAGFPEPLVPADNPMSTAKVELGRRLFGDTRLSGNETLSCAGCHHPELAFTDGRGRARGATGELHPRSSMSLLNVAYNRTLTWADPTVDSLEEQMLTPMFGEHPVELGLAGMQETVVARLRAAGYHDAFAAAFPEASEPLIFDHVIQAIAAYERTLFAGSSPYDRWLFFDEPLAEPARRGMRLFFSERLACSACHVGFNLSGPVVHAGDPEAEPEFHNTALYNRDGGGSYPPDNVGLYGHTGLPEDMGKFRAPTLRNIALTAPYMHDGSVATLEEVVDHYAAGGRNLGLGETAGHNPLKSPRMHGFELTETERADLLAFLASLTDRPGSAVARE